MASGALNIISGTPLTLSGLERLVADPVRPELGFGLAVVAALYLLAPRLSGAVLIPLVAVVATVLVNLFLASGICELRQCSPERWMFTALHDTAWIPPWRLDWGSLDLGLLVQSLPGMLVVAFVGILTIVLSLASLELSFEREFDLNRALKLHAVSAGAAALSGGFFGIISLSRTALNHQTRGGAIAGTIAAVMCLATLFGAGEAVGYIAKGALGGLILYLGLNMLKLWVWDQRKTSSTVELAQIVLILALTANYGFLVSFAAGVLIACMIFVVTYSRIPLANLTTDLSALASSVVRSEPEREILREHGDKTVVYRLSGYVFFGSASRIDAYFKDMDIDRLEGVVIDFSQVSGIDRSAIGVFQRILRRYNTRPIEFYFVTSTRTKANLELLSLDPLAGRRVSYFPALDYALESAEERIIAKRARVAAENAGFEFLEDGAERRLFASYCEHRRVGKDEALCTEGDRSNEVFFVEAGSFDVIKASDSGGNVRLAKLHPGSLAGELAFYTGEARTASIIAVMESSVYVLRRDALAEMRTRHPSLGTKFDHMVIRNIAGALARTNKLIATLS
jgi:SulP family sulfate permease